MITVEDLITKLRAQAAELISTANAMEVALASHAFATGAGRHLVGVAVGDWVTWSEAPNLALVQDAEGDIAFRHADGTGDWVGIFDSAGIPSWWSPTRNRRHFESLSGSCQIIAMDLTGDEDVATIQRYVENHIENFK